MKWLKLIILILPSMGISRAGATCNFAAIYLGETKVLLTSFSIGTSVTPKGFPSCGEHGVEGNVIHRIFLDIKGVPTFGYDIQILANPGKSTFRIKLMKPHTTFTVQNFMPGKETTVDGKPRVNFPGPREITVDGTQLVTFSKLPDPVSLGDGDRVDVPVLEDSKTGEHILDSYAIASPRTGIAPVPTHGAIPSYAPTGTLLSLEQPHLYNAFSEFGDNLQFGATGPVVWVYSRWLGKFSFSASPRAGYRRVAVAERSRISFSAGVEDYTLEVHRDVVPHPGTWWLWMKQEPEIKLPTGPWTDEELRSGRLGLGAER